MQAFFVPEKLMLLDILLVSFILLSLILIALIIKVLGLQKLVRRQANQIEAMDILIGEVNTSLKYALDDILQKSQHQTDRLNEVDQVSRQLEHRISSIKDGISHLTQQIEAVQAQEPEDRFYSRALKLAKLGSSVDEIMSECEIPRAEAEMLVSVHKKQK